MTNTLDNRHCRTDHRIITLYSLDIQAFIWLGLPALLFLGGWMRWYIALPIIILLIFTTIHTLPVLKFSDHDAASQNENTPIGWNSNTVDRTYILSLTGLFAVLVLMGHGGFMYQHSDFFYRNAVMFDLSTHDWPVLYGTDKPRILCYYFAYLLPASLLFIFAPLPCVGISLAIAFVLIKGGRRSLSITNTAGQTSIASALFYMSNNNAAALDKNTMAGTTQILIIGLVFFISAIGIYLPFVWKQASRNVIFIIVLTTGMLVPFLAMGNSDDLGRRSLIPAMIMLIYMIIRRLGELKTMKLIQVILFSLVLLIGANTSLEAIIEHYEYNRDLMSDRGLIVKKIDLMGRLDKKKFNYCYDNFIAEGDSFYTRYMMKK